MSDEQLIAVGAQVRNFLLGLLQDGYGEGALMAALAGPGAPPYDPEGPLIAPDPNKVVVAMNVSARLPVGSLVMGAQNEGRIYRYTPQTQETEIIASFHNTPMLIWHSAMTKDAEFYIAMSGTRRNNPNNPYEVLFGQGGCIIHLTLREETFNIVPGSPQFTDPVHLEWLPSGHLLVVDFEGFGGSGAVYEMDPLSGSRTTLARGVPLRDPCTAAIAADGTIYIANASQSYVFETEAGAFQRDSGSIVQIDRSSGQMRTIYDETSSPKGGIVGVVATKDPRFVIVVRSDWPSGVGSALLRLDVTSGTATPIIEANASEPRFFGHAAVAIAGDTLYAIDSYRKELVTIDIARGSTSSSIPMREVLGPAIGMTTPMETIEWIDVIS